MSQSQGRFGMHGGQYIPETLMNAVIELDEAYTKYKNDPEFQAELTDLLNNYAGRPSRLYYAAKMTKARQIRYLAEGVAAGPVTAQPSTVRSGALI